MGAFGPPVQEQVLKALCDNPIKKRDVAKAGNGKQSQEKMIAYRDKIVEFRRDTQLAEVESGATAEREKRQSKQSILTPSANVSDSVKVSDCRICKEVQSQGNVQNFCLFENQPVEKVKPFILSNSVSSTKLEQRRKINKRSKSKIKGMN